MGCVGVAEILSQILSWIVIWSNHSSVALAACSGYLSCWKVDLGPILKSLADWNCFFLKNLPVFSAIHFFL